MLGFLSFMAWFIAGIAYLGFILDRPAKKEGDSISVGDVVAFPGMVLFVLWPILAVVGLVFLMALPFT